MFSVLSKASKADITLANPCALEENSASPIEEVPVIPVWEVFDHQCLDPTARLIRERVVTDPSWDHDQNGLLVRRLETGETSLHVPASLQQPCAVIHAFPDVNVSPALTASSIPVATDGSALIRGVKDGESTENSFGKSTENSFATTPTSTRPVLYILTRSPIPRQLPTSVGLALVTVPEEASAIPTGAETGVGAISSSELRVPQATDPDCQRFLSLTARAELSDLNEDGILIRIAPSDGSRQIVVPRSLVSRVLFLEHYPPAIENPGAHRMFRTIRRSFFWPRMVEDVYDTVRQCDLCARNRISEKRRTNPLKLFPAKGPLESVAMAILGPLPRTKHGNRFLLVIADRFSKVTNKVPLRTVNALSVARAFCDHRAYVYGPPVSLLTDNGPQFTAKFFQAVCAELGIHKVFKTAYHPQTNGQVERYNRTVLASLRGYVQGCSNIRFGEFVF
jgi:Integrase zinc binding domain/Integrase core domain